MLLRSNGPPDGKMIPVNVWTDAFSLSLAAHVLKIIYDNNLMLNFISVGLTKVCILCGLYVERMTVAYEKLFKWVNI